MIKGVLTDGNKCNCHDDHRYGRDLGRISCELNSCSQEKSFITFHKERRNIVFQNLTFDIFLTGSPVEAALPFSHFLSFLALPQF